MNERTVEGSALKSKTEPHLVWVDCYSCHGSGGRGYVWDADISRNVPAFCSSCSGRGEVRVWSDQLDTTAGVS